MWTIYFSKSTQSNKIQSQTASSSRQMSCWCWTTPLVKTMTLSAECGGCEMLPCPHFSLALALSDSCLLPKIRNMSRDTILKNNRELRAVATREPREGEIYLISPRILDRTFLSWFTWLYKSSTNFVAHRPFLTIASCHLFLSSCLLSLVCLLALSIGLWRHEITFCEKKQREL